MFMLEPMPMLIPTAKPISEPMPMLMFMLMFMLMIMLMGYACAHGNASAYVLLIVDVYPKFFHAREITHNPTLVSRTDKQIANTRNNAKLSARQLGEPVQVTPTFQKHAADSQSQEDIL